MAWSGEISSDLCIDCQLDPLPVDWTAAWGHYRAGLERLLHAFKFERHDFLEDSLAMLLIEAIDIRGDREFDVVVPVPMHRSKERRRGYNQAELLARAVAQRLAVPCDPRLLTKTRERKTQSMLPRSERAANVRGAFRASTEAAAMSVLLVDDVCTTGETFRACAAELLHAGAKRVCAVAVAKA
jgi:competence protein ComFC